MARMVKLDVWVVVDENEAYDVGTNEDEAADRYAKEVSTSTSGEVGIRRVKITVTVPVPAPIELAATVTTDETPSLTVTP